MDLEVQLFGSARVRIANEQIDFLPDKRYQLLAYLAFEHDWVSRDQLAHLFWSDVSSKTARHSLRQLLKRVKALTWLASLEAERERIRWLVSTDYQTFKTALKKQDLPALHLAYTGKFLKGLESDESNAFNDWLFHEREHLYNQWRSTSLQFVEALGQRQNYQEASDLLRHLLEADSLDEDTVQLYMQIQLSANKPNEGLLLYTEFASELAKEMELEPSALTEQLKESLAQLAKRPILSASADSREVQSPLPTASTSFIGRRNELESIHQHFFEHHCRLLTLIGPGGIGKSRIALRAAHDLKEEFENGSYFIALETIQDIEQIPQSIAKGLGLTLDGQLEPALALQDAIADKGMLLVLDNLEHLLDASRFLAKLLAGCRKLCILATSRERLNLEEEWLLPIEGMSLGDADSYEEAMTYDALQLFNDRVKRVAPHFQLGIEHLTAMRAIIQLLEGAPLGIELAAARVRFSPVDEIAKDIKENLDSLSATASNVAYRHMSLRATFDYSWQLLTKKEQGILQSLAVFQGGFQREAAALVAQAPIAILAALLDKSLLRITPTNRFEQHPLIYQYALEKLSHEADVLDKAKEKHAAYYPRLLNRWDEDMRGRHSDFAGDLELEWPNIRAAWLYTVDKHRARDILLRALALRNACLSLTEYQDAVTLFSKASQQFDNAITEEKSVYATCVICEAWFHFRLGNLEQARSLATKGLMTLGHLYQGARFIGLNTLASAAWRRGDYEEAKAKWQEGLLLADKQNDKEHIIAFSSNLGVVAEYQGDLSRAKRHYEKVLVLARQVGNTTRLSSALNNLGALLMQLGLTDKASELLYEGLELARQQGFKQRIYVLLSNLAQLASSRKDYTQAYSYANEALELAQQAGDKVHESSILDRLANIALLEGDDAKTKAFLQKGLSIAWEKRALAEVMQLLTSFAGFIAQHETKQAAILAHVILGQTVTTMRSSEIIKQLLRQIELPKKELADAKEKASLLTLDKVVEQLLASEHFVFAV